jgi:hypothetical protein
LPGEDLHCAGWQRFRGDKLSADRHHAGASLTTLRGVARQIADEAVNRQFLKQVLLGVFVYLSVVLALEALVFVLSHIPPMAANLDPLVAPLARVEIALLWSKQLLRSLWPGETSSRLLLWSVTVANWLLWGFLLALLWRLWRRVRD